MKAKNLKAKPYIIPCSKSENILLAPAGPAVSIPEDADVAYLKKLAVNGMVKITEDSAAKKTTAQKTATDAADKDE